MPEKNLIRTKKSIIKLLYQLMFDIHQILRNSGIPYWIIGGTFLGAIRNKGIIPWDDDLDIGILNKYAKILVSLKPIFAKCRYGIVKTWFGYKIFYKKRKNLPNEKYSFPNLDVFTYTKRGTRYVQSRKGARDSWPKEWYPVKDIVKLKKYEFGEIVVIGPSEYKAYFNRLYGRDWNTVAYRQYDHSKDEEIESIKVRLTNKDRKPAEPTDKLVNHNCIHSTLCLRPTRKINPNKYITKPKKKCRITDKKCLNNFDVNMGVYVINCDAHKGRMKKFEKYGKRAKLRFCRESCIKGSKFTYNLFCEMKKRKLISKTSDMNAIEVAINLSHYNVWQRIINNCEDYGLIMEDDVEVKSYFVKKVNGIMNDLEDKSIDFSVLFLWNGNWAETDDYLERVTRAGGFTIYQETNDYNAGGVAYIISKKFAVYMLKKGFPIKDPQDMFMGGKVRHGRHLTLKMGYNRKDECYVSPLLNMECGGEGSTGVTTQEYDSPKIKHMKCIQCPKK